MGSVAEALDSVVLLFLPPQAIMDRCIASKVWRMFEAKKIICSTHMELVFISKPSNLNLVAENKYMRGSSIFITRCDRTNGSVAFN
jgi:hypothetical protein